MEIIVLLAISGALIAGFVFVIWKIFAGNKRRFKNYERALSTVTLMIHLPPRTDDIQGGGRDKRDVTNEALQQAQVMYSIISSTLSKGFKSALYGQKHLSLEIVAHNGLIHYYAVVPRALRAVVAQAVTAAYPTARLEEVDDPNFFNEEGGMDTVVGGELELKDDYWYPIASYEDTKRDASLGLINALSVAKKGDGIGVQIMFRPCSKKWVQKSLQRVKSLKDGKKLRHGGGFMAWLVEDMGHTFVDIIEALWRPPDPHDPYEEEKKVLTNLEQEEVQRIEEKTKYPGFQVLVRIVASSKVQARSELLAGGVVSVFSQFDLPNYNGFRYNMINNPEQLLRDYVLRVFPPEKRYCILNSVELSSIFHLPSQDAIPTSQVERQATKQVDGPGRLSEEGVILGVNEFRGEKKTIRLGIKDRRRHTYVIGATGMGKSILLTNIAYQDMCNGDGFAFIDPHGDAAELLMSKVPPERMDDVIYFEPGNMENPVGMNMFEFADEGQKDFIVQESLNMMISLYDPGNQGIFGPRAQHMFRNAALLLMSDPEGGTFIDVPRCFTDPEFVKSKLKYVTDKTVYDYWTKEFPASQKSNDAGEVTSWFVSKWGPFISNKMMRNILGQTKSGFNIREIMDNRKILLINLSKGKTGELNAKLLGMIFVMKFQAAAMSRADTPEDDRKDFCLFVDEFQNFSTESFESILSEARKYRLNLVLANQFMTQLTDKIREAILGNVGTIMSGRLGVTDAQLMEKAFTPIFNAEDLHAMPNYSAVATVMMFGMPTSPFTMKLLPPMGESSDELMERMKEYASSKYGRPRVDVEREINARLADAPSDNTKKDAAAAAKPAGAQATMGAGGAGAAPGLGPVQSRLMANRARIAARRNAIAKEQAEQEERKKAEAAKSANAGAEVAKPVAADVTTMEGAKSKSAAMTGGLAALMGANASKEDSVDHMMDNLGTEMAENSAWAKKATENAANAKAAAEASGAAPVSTPVATPATAPVSAPATAPAPAPVSTANSDPNALRISHSGDSAEAREERARRRAEALKARAQLEEQLNDESEEEADATAEQIEEQASAATTQLVQTQNEEEGVLRWR